MAERLPVGQGEKLGRAWCRLATVPAWGQPEPYPAAAGALHRCRSDPQLRSGRPFEPPRATVPAWGQPEPYPAATGALHRCRSDPQLRFGRPFEAPRATFYARGQPEPYREAGAGALRRRWLDPQLRTVRHFETGAAFVLPWENQNLAVNVAVVQVQGFTIGNQALLSPCASLKKDLQSNSSSPTEQSEVRPPLLMDIYAECEEEEDPYDVGEQESYDSGETLELEGDARRSFYLSTLSGGSDELIHKVEKGLIGILEKNLEDILNALFSRSVISPEEYVDFKNMEGDSKETSQRLLVMIQEKGEQTCSLFLECVEMTCPGSLQILDQSAQALDENPGHVPEPMILSLSDAPLLANESKGRTTKIFTKPEEWTRCSLCHSEDLSETIEPDVVWESERRSEIYRFCPTEAGSFHCCYTDLIFEVRGAATITYQFGSWKSHLSAMDAQNLMVAGPLLDIQADPKEAVAAIHFPHFLCLKGEDKSHLYIAHFLDEGMSLERPDRVGPFHTVLKDPTFSLFGTVLQILGLKQNIMVHAVVLLYQVLEISVPEFHLYLFPKDPRILMTVEKHEEKCPSRRVQKPPQVTRPLKFGSCCMLKADGVTVCPEELELEKGDMEIEHPYLEVFAPHMGDGLELNLVEKESNESVWKAFVRHEELRMPGLLSAQELTPSGPSRLHFIERHRAELIQRTCSVEMILDTLVNVVINSESYDKISSRNTNQDKMRELYKLVPSWNENCKNTLYVILKATNKFLIAELEQKDKLRN